MKYFFQVQSNQNLFLTHQLLEWVMQGKNYIHIISLDWGSFLVNRAQSKEYGSKSYLLLLIKVLNCTVIHKLRLKFENLEVWDIYKNILHNYHIMFTAWLISFLLLSLNVLSFNLILRQYESGSLSRAKHFSSLGHLVDAGRSRYIKLKYTIRVGPGTFWSDTGYPVCGRIIRHFGKENNL